MANIRAYSRRAVLLTAGAVLASTSWNSLAADATHEITFANRNATGEELVNAFFDLLSSTGSPTGIVGTTTEQDDASKALVKPYLDPAFQLQRSSGERYVASTYVPADVDDFEIGDVRESRPTNDVLVVRYSVRTTQTLPDAALVMSKEKAPRLTVFHWSDADTCWRVLSHGNFNTPIASVCDRDPSVDNGMRSSAQGEDQALGESLIGRFYDLLVIGDSAPILHPFFQYQSAIGVGFTTLAERKKTTKFPKTSFEHAVVTRNGKLLVVSVYCETATERLLMQQYKLRAGKSMHLATFIEDNVGTWSMIALASFIPAESLPESAECVPEGKLEEAQL